MDDEHADGLWCMWRGSVTCCAQTCADFLGVPKFSGAGGHCFFKDENEGVDVDFGFPLSQSTVLGRRNNRCQSTQGTQEALVERCRYPRDTLCGKLRTWPLSVHHVLRTLPQRGAHSLVVSAADRDLGKHPERVQGHAYGVRKVFTRLGASRRAAFQRTEGVQWLSIGRSASFLDMDLAAGKERAAGGEHDQKAAPKAGGGEFSVQVLVGSADHDRMTRLGDTQEDAQSRSTTFWRSQCEQKDSKVSQHQSNPPFVNPGTWASNHPATIRQLTGHFSLLGVSAALSERVRRT